MHPRHLPSTSLLRLVFVFAVALLVVGTGRAFAACSASNSFFVYGACPSARARERKVVHAGLFFGLAKPLHGGVWAGQPQREGNPGALYAYTESRPIRANGKPTSLSARLTVRCRDSNTSLYFTFPGQRMGNKGAQREFVYALDGGGEKILELERATDHATMGVWQGYRAVPLAKKLLSAHAMKISAITTTGTELRADFTLDGLDGSIKRLRQTCRW